MFAVGRANRISWAYSCESLRPLLDDLCDYVESRPRTFWCEGVDDWNAASYTWVAWDFENEADHVEIVRRFGPVMNNDWEGPWRDPYPCPCCYDPPPGDFFNLAWEYDEANTLEYGTVEELGRFAHEFDHWKSRCSSTSPRWYTRSRPSRGSGKTTGITSGWPNGCTRPSGFGPSFQKGRTTAAPIAESALTSFLSRNSARRSNTY